MGKILSTEEMVAKLAAMPAAIEEAKRAALEKIAEVVQAEAEIGHDQEDIAPFVDWPDLAPSTREDKQRLGYAPPDNPLRRTGEIRAKIDRSVIGDTAYIGSNDDIAEYQELGTTHIPPRSFLGATLVRKTDEVVKIAGDAVYGALIGERMLSLVKVIGE